MNWLNLNSKIWLLRGFCNSYDKKYEAIALDES